MRHHGQTRDDIEYSIDLNSSEPNAFSSVVEPGNSQQTAEYDAASLQRRNEVFVNKSSEVLESRDNGFVPTFVSLKISVRMHPKEPPK